MAAILIALKQRGVRFRGLIVGNDPEEAAMRAALSDAVFAGFLMARRLRLPTPPLTSSSSRARAKPSAMSRSKRWPRACLRSANDASGSRFLVIDGETGFLATANTETEFVARLSELIADAPLRSRMSEAARALEFNWDRSLSDLCRNYAGVLNSEAMPGQRSG